MWCRHVEAQPNVAHDEPAALPMPRAYHVSCALGTARCLIFGGQCDDGSMADDAPGHVGELLPIALAPTCITLSTVAPRLVASRGGDSLTIRGDGFRPGMRYTVYFGVPRPLPPSSIAASSLPTPWS